MRSPVKSRLPVSDYMTESHVNIRVYVHAYAGMHICSNVICVYTHDQCIYIYIYTHMCMHMCMQVCTCAFTSYMWTVPPTVLGCGQMGSTLMGPLQK